MQNTVISQQPWSQKFPRFSGKEPDWYRWSLCFLSYAALEGYVEILKNKQVVAMSDDDVAHHVEKGKELTDTQNTRRVQNSHAYHDLLAACQNDRSFSCVARAMTDKLPNGDAKQAWRNLTACFEYNMPHHRIELRKKFQTMELNDKNQDPTNFCNRIDRIASQLRDHHGDTIDESSIIIQILQNLPVDYDELVSQLERLLTEGNLQMENLKDELYSKYLRIKRRTAAKKNRDEDGGSKKGRSPKNKNSEEVGLCAGGEKSGKNAGKCDLCPNGKHLAKNCWKRPENKNKRPDWYVLCPHCGQGNHPTSRCWKKLKEHEECNKTKSQ